MRSILLSPLPPPTPPLPHEDIERSQPSAKSQEERPHQEPNLLAPDLGFPASRTVRNASCLSQSMVLCHKRPD